MTILATTQSKCTLVLLPSAHSLPPLPKTVGSSNLVSLAESLEWSQDTMDFAQKILLDSVVEHAKTKWQHRSEPGNLYLLRKKDDVGEGEMYI